MNKTTLKALTQSIKHWERMRDGKRRKSKEGDGELERPFEIDCSLCDRFVAHWCAGCPIMISTGKDHCVGGPYSNARRAWDHEGPESASFKKEAQKMIDFLISLRPQS